MSDTSDQRRYYERMMDEIAEEHRRAIAELQAENEKLRELISDTLMDVRDYCAKYGIDIDDPWGNANADLDRRMRELGIDNGVGRSNNGVTRWAQLFGTPERAAEYFAMQCFGSDGSLCYYCPFDDCDENLRDMGTYSSVHDMMLEWLRGDA